MDDSSEQQANDIVAALLKIVTQPTSAPNQIDNVLKKFDLASLINTPGFQDVLNLIKHDVSSSISSAASTSPPRQSVSSNASGSVQLDTALVCPFCRKKFAQITSFHQHQKCCTYLASYGPKATDEYSSTGVMMASLLDDYTHSRVNQNNAGAMSPLLPSDPSMYHTETDRGHLSHMSVADVSQASFTELPMDLHSCAKCHMAFTEMNALKVHEITAHNLVQYRCEECPRKYKTQIALKQHVEATHFTASPPSTTKERHFKCDLCPMSFTQCSSLKRHSRTIHDKKKDFRCDLCGKQFGEQGNLFKHKKTVHEKRYDYLCPVEDCRKRFGQAASLRRHGFLVHSIDSSGVLIERSPHHSGSATSLENSEFDAREDERNVSFPAVPLVQVLESASQEESRLLAIQRESQEDMPEIDIDHSGKSEHPIEQSFEPSALTLADILTAHLLANKKAMAKEQRNHTNRSEPKSRKIKIQHEEDDMNGLKPIQKAFRMGRVANTVDPTTKTCTVFQDSLTLAMYCGNSDLQNRMNAMLQEQLT